MALPNRIRRQFLVLASVGACALFGGLMNGELASAQLAYVPRHVTVIGGVYGGADTAQSAALRGQGQYMQGLGQLYQGQGHYLTGAGNYLQGLGQYQKDHQIAYAMSFETYSRQVAWRDEWKKIRAAEQQDRIIANKQKNDAARLDRLRDHASHLSVTNGDALNYLWNQLGSRVTAIPFQSLSLTAAELKSVRLQFANGFTLERLQRAFTPDVKVNWPEPLRRFEFDADRSKIAKSLENSQYAAAIQQCQALEVVAGRTLSHRDRDGGPEVWAAVSEFCTALRQTLELIKSNDLTRAHSLLSYQPQNTADLIRHMNVYGLRFAPTSDIGGAAYRMLHASLAAAHQDPSLTQLKVPLPNTTSTSTPMTHATAAQPAAVRNHHHADAFRKWLPSPVL